MESNIPQIIIDDIGKQQLFDQIQQYIKDHRND